MIWFIRRRSWLLTTLVSWAVLGFANVSSAVPPTTDTFVRFNTTLGSFDVELYDSATPITVTNFLTYVNANTNNYNNSFFHRLVQGFVLQGGGFNYDGTNVNPIATNAPIVNEFSVTRSNLIGTIAMAKTAAGPDSATNQFFFNLADNSANLDNQNGGFTVFGKVVGSGMTVVNKLAGVSPNMANVGFAPAPGFASPFDQIPLINYPANSPAPGPFFEMVSSVTVLPTNQWNLTGGGTWATGASWLNGTSPSSTGAKALLANKLVGAGSIDLGTTAQTVNTLEFASGSNNGAYTITGNGAGVLTLSSGTNTATIQLDSTNSVAQTITAPVSFATYTTINNQSASSAKLVLGGQQNYTAGVTVSVNNSAVGSGAVKFLNATTGAVGAGVSLSVASGNSLELAGTTSGTTGVALANTGALTVSGTNQQALSISGTGTTTVATGSAMTIGTTGITQKTLSIGGTLRSDGNTNFATAFNPASAGLTTISGNTGSDLAIVAGGNAKLGTVSFTSATGGLNVAATGNLIAGNISGQAIVTVNGTATLGNVDGTAITATTFNGTTTVGNNGLLTANRVVQNALNINGTNTLNGAKVTIASSTGSPNEIAGLDSQISILSSLSISKSAGATPTYFGTLDVQNNDLFVTYTTGNGTTVYNNLLDMIRSGANRTNQGVVQWNGTGLTSSAAAGNPSLYALGVYDNAALNASGHGFGDGTTFPKYHGTVVVQPNTVFVKFTYAGDTNGDGIIDINDYQAVTTNINTVATGYSHGDINGDGVVNLDDFQPIDVNISNPVANSGLNGGLNVVPLPEPSSFVLAGLGLLGLLLAQRRRVRR